MRDAVDFVSPPDPVLLQKLGLDALVYTGSARPSQDWIDTARGRGITVTFIQETISTRSQQGFQAGVLDCQFAEVRAKERGHSGSIAVVVSDGSWVDEWDCSEYGRGWQSVATLPFFAYGSTGCCESFNRGASHSLGTWIPETWGAGSLMTQVVGPSPVPDSDLNHVHADYTGGTQEDDMTPEQAQLLTDVHNAIFDKNLGLQKVVVNDIPAQFQALKTELEAKIAAIPGGTGTAVTHGTWTAG